MSYGQFGLSRNQMLGIGGVGTVALGGGGAYLLNRRRKARLAAEAEAAMLADEADEAEYAMAVAQGATFRRPLMSPRMATGLKIGGGVGALGLAGAGAYAGHRLRKARLAAEAEAAMLAEEDEAEYAMALAQGARFGLSRNQMLGIGGVGVAALGGGGAYALNRRRKARLAAETEAAMLAEEDEAEYAMAQAQGARFGALARRNFLLSRTGRLAGKIGAGVAGVGALGAGGYGVYRATRPPVIEEDELEGDDDDAMYAMARPSAANFGNLARNNRWLSKRGRLAGKIGAGVAGVGALGAGGYGAYRATRPPVIEEEMDEDEYIDE